MSCLQSLHDYFSIGYRMIKKISHAICQNKVIQHFTFDAQTCFNCYDNIVCNQTGGATLFFRGDGRDDWPSHADLTTRELSENTYIYKSQCTH